MWVVGRLLQTIMLLLALSAIVFAGLHLVGNPADLLIAPDADQAERARAMAAFGFDQPLWRQYWLFLAAALHGDLGRSFVFGEPALHLIAERLPATLELAGLSMLLAIAVGLPLGIHAGLHPDGVAGRALMTGSIFGFSLPGFWVGLVLILVFAVGFGWLPSSGRGATVYGWSFLTLDGLRHLALPVLNLALADIALVIRLTENGVRQIMPRDFIRFARAQGIRQRRIVWVRLLRHIAVLLATVMGVEFAGSIAFSLVTESVFAWPGIGRLLLSSLTTLDRPVIAAYLLLAGAVFMAINLLADLLAAWLDPRRQDEAVR